MAEYPKQFNPYVGPRTFREEEALYFFGRELEARDLKSMLVSHRLVSFYAQSGAGKSSLVNARLIRSLRADGFEVLPVGRVSGGVGPDVKNPFVSNLLISLDQDQRDPRLYGEMTLAQFLAGFRSVDGTFLYTYPDEANDFERDDAKNEHIPRVLIIDQFEEIFTTNIHAWEEREDFFRQLSEAMGDDRELWVLLAMRDDYIAALDPYAHLLPGNLRARFYMQRMGYEAAREAIMRPAEMAGRPFERAAAEYLVDDLRRIQTHRQAETQLGRFVEPQQLQVVCYQLWENLPAGPPVGAITVDDVQRGVGNVDTALIEFYEQAISQVVLETGLSEPALRRWFEEQLITEAGTRGLVYRGAEDTGGLPNVAVDLLADTFLLRAEARAGGIWYELVNDRFIDPILRANQAWSAEQPFVVRMAHNWAASGRPSGLLLSGSQLEEALASHSPEASEPLVREFIEASRQAQDYAEAYSARRFRRLIGLIVILAITNIVTLLFAIWVLFRAA